MMCYSKELLQVDEAENQVILTTFQAGLLLGDFFFLNHQESTKNSGRATSLGLEIYECRRRSDR